MPLMYAGILTCLDGYMNIAMEQTEVGSFTSIIKSGFLGDFWLQASILLRVPVVAMLEDVRMLRNMWMAS